MVVVVEIVVVVEVVVMVVWAALVGSCYQCEVKSLVVANCMTAS